MRTHLVHPDDPRTSACGHWWRGRGMLRRRPRLVEADASCTRCPRRRRQLDELRAARLLRYAGRPLFVFDFDGVFNHAAFYQARATARASGAFAVALGAEVRAPHPRIRFTYADHATPTTPSGAARPPMFDRACVERAGELVRVAGGVAAVSSSWREGDSLVGLRALLVAYGFAPEVPFIGATPIHDSGDRTGEIVAFLDELPVAPEALVVIDDDPIGDPLSPFYVRTDPNAGGLTDELVRVAAAMVSCPPAPIPWRQGGTR